MKKLMSVCMTVILACSIFTAGISAEATTNEQYNIPKANTAPVIDGKITDDEWDNALVRELTADNVSDPSNTGLDFAGATFRWMWDDAGMYVFASVNDTTEPDAYPVGGDGSYNSGDGIQVCIYADDTLTGSEIETLFFFSMIPKADDGKAYVGEHFVYGIGTAGDNVDEAQIAVQNKDGGYDIECFIAKEAFVKSTPPVEIKEGTVLPLANIVMEKDGATQALFTDTAWFSGVDSNKYTLTSDVAGHVEKAEEPAETVAAETQTEETVADTAETVAETTAEPIQAPQTGEKSVLSAAAIGMLGLAGAIIALRKSKDKE